MNYRRALRIATNTGLAVFIVMLVGVVLWTTDEVLGWNILPDWIDRYAELIVIVLAIVAAFAVVTSVMCSFAVIAEAAAEKAGLVNPPPARRVRAAVAVGLVAAAGVMFTLHQVDRHRAEQRRVAEETEARERYARAEQELRDRLPATLALFTPELIGHLTASAAPEGDEAVARLMAAIQLSTPHDPDVSLLVRADPPYRYCRITPADRRSRAEGAFLDRQFLTDLPSGWEREAIEAYFAGDTPSIPERSRGVVFDTRSPAAHGSLAGADGVAALLVLRADN